jgi:hypothetical protein
MPTIASPVSATCDDWAHTNSKKGISFEPVRGRPCATPGSPAGAAGLPTPAAAADPSNAAGTHPGTLSSLQHALQRGSQTCPHPASCRCAWTVAPAAAAAAACAGLSDLQRQVRQQVQEVEWQAQGELAGGQRCAIEWLIYVELERLAAAKQSAAQDGAREYERLSVPRVPRLSCVRFNRSRPVCVLLCLSGLQDGGGQSTKGRHSLHAQTHAGACAAAPLNMLLKTLFVTRLSSSPARSYRGQPDSTTLLGVPAKQLRAHLTPPHGCCAAASAAAPARGWPAGAPLDVDLQGLAAQLAAMKPQPGAPLRGPICGWDACIVI